MDEAMSGSDNEPSTKGDLRALKSDVSAFRSELKADFAQFRTEIRELFRPITITLAHHTAELADIRGHIKDKMVTREEFHSRMDGFTARMSKLGLRPT